MKQSGGFVVYRIDVCPHYVLLDRSNLALPAFDFGHFIEALLILYLCPRVVFWGNLIRHCLHLDLHLVIRGGDTLKQEKYWPLFLQDETLDKCKMKLYTFVRLDLI